MVAGLLKLKILFFSCLLLTAIAIVKVYIDQLNEIYLNDDVYMVDVFDSRSLADYNIKPKGICDSEEVLLFSYVFVSVDNFERRNVIRQTWANRSMFSDVKVAFVLGLSIDQNVNYQ